MAAQQTLVYQVVWRESRAPSWARIPVWLRRRPKASRGGRGSAGRRCLQPRWFPRRRECGWRRAAPRPRSAAGECWRRSDGPSGSPLGAESRVFTEPSVGRCREGGPRGNTQKWPRGLTLAGACVSGGSFASHPVRFLDSCQPGFPSETMEPFPAAKEVWNK